MGVLDPPRVDLDERGLALAVQDNLHALFRAIATVLPDAELEESEVVSRHHALPPNPMFKGVWGLRGDADAADAALVESLAWLYARRAPFAFVTLGPGCDPPGLRERLAARGVEAWELDAPGMAAELDALDWDALERVPAELEIRRVEDAAGLEDFVRVFAAGFGAPEWAGQAWLDATLTVGISEAPWSFQVARLDGKPVATAISFNGGGVASVFAVGAVPKVRGRGIGTAITLAGYADAREQGFRHAVLFATELGLPVYRRLGFREVDCRISRYLWRAGYDGKEQISD